VRDQISEIPDIRRFSQSLRPFRVDRTHAQHLLRALLLLILASPSLASEPKFPPLTGRVVDDASVLNASTQSQLTDMLAAHERATGQQVVVVTLDSLQGYTIEDYGYQLGRYWGIGQKGKNNGVLLIVAPKEHKVRIEVGYGLEGTLTDATSRTIIENDILPSFKRGDFNVGVVAGTTSILSVLGGNPLEASVPTRASAPNTSGVPIAVAVLLWAVLIFTLPMIFLFLRALLTGRVRQLDSYGRDSEGRYVGGTSSAEDGGGFSGGGGGFSGGGGSFGGGGASGSW
jgi:uncharacterized protein